MFHFPVGLLCLSCGACGDRARWGQSGEIKKQNESRRTSEEEVLRPPAAAIQGTPSSFLIHYLDEINKINQMNVRWDPCRLFAYLPTDSRRACA